MHFTLIKKLIPFVRPYKVRVTIVTLLSFALAAIGGAQVSLVRPIFDKGLGPDMNSEVVWVLAFKLLILGLINFPCRFYHFYGIRFIVDHATCQLREDIFRKMQKLPTSFFNNAKQGEMISNLINDTHIFSGGFKSIIDLIREPLKAAVYLGMAFYGDWQLTLVIFLMAPFLVAIFNVSGRKVKNNQSEVQQEHGLLTHNISEGLASHKVTKAFNLQEFVIGRFQKTQERFFSSQLKTTFVEEFAHPLVEVVGAVAFSGVIIFAHYRISSGATSVGEFISFIAALALFMDPIRKFSQANIKFSQAKAAGERIFSLLDLPEEPDFGKQEIVEFKDKIEVKNVSFSYGEGKVIENLNLEVKKGEKIALVGLSGSGKSTLINLLLGLYPIEEGEILIDGISIKDISLESLRNLFGFVGQDIFLFNDSIENNLLVGHNFSDDEISKALEVSYADEFINKLPEGIKTVIGDRGAKISGGQKQRITIARAFLQDSDIFLFDEATSALDNESEKIVQKALESIAKEKTVVAVAHRLSTIQDYDRIYVLRDGFLIEQGNHSHLLSIDGEYAKLHQLSS